MHPLNTLLYLLPLSLFHSLPVFFFLQLLLHYNIEPIKLDNQENLKFDDERCDTINPQEVRVFKNKATGAGKQHVSCSRTFQQG